MSLHGLIKIADDLHKVRNIILKHLYYKHQAWCLSHSLSFFPPILFPRLPSPF